MYLGQAFAAGSDCVLLAGVVSEFDGSEIGTGRAVPAIQRSSSSQHNTHTAHREPPGNEGKSKAICQRMRTSTRERDVMRTDEKIRR